MPQPAAGLYCLSTLQLVLQRSVCDGAQIRQRTPVQHGDAAARRRVLNAIVAYNSSIIWSVLANSWKHTTENKVGLWLV